MPPSEIRPLAIVAALHDELSALLALVAGEPPVRVGGRDFWPGRLHGQPVVLALSRIGKVAAAATAAVLLERFGARAVVFTGVAGALAPGVAVGDVVVARELLQHDLDASPLFPRWEVPLTGRARFAADAALADGLAGAAERLLAVPDGWLDAAARQRFGLAAPRVHRGLLVSGDRFVASAAERMALHAALPDALAVEMEGAAMAQVCHDWGVPFAALRTISDRADDSAPTDFPRFVAEVGSRYSAAIVQAWLGTMPLSNL